MSPFEKSAECETVFKITKIGYVEVLGWKLHYAFGLCTAADWIKGWPHEDGIPCRLFTLEEFHEEF